jgi:hypothetical protein
MSLEAGVAAAPTSEVGECCSASASPIPTRLICASSCSHSANCRATQMGGSAPVPIAPAQGVQTLPQLLVPIANALDFSEHALLEFSR